MNNKSEKPDMIRPLSELETAKHINFYKEFLNKQRQNDPANSHLYDKVEQLYCVHSKIDPKCILEVKRRLVRVEYPGDVKNVDKAISTLGGLEGIEASVGDSRKKLEMRLHYKNKYNKCAMATRDYQHGLLIKVTIKKAKDNQVLSCDYEVVGVTVLNFVFNRLNDFQYLPLCTAVNEDKNTETENIYHKIIPEVMPSLEWVESDLSMNSEPYLPPPRFAFYDNAENKLVRDSKYELDETTLPSSKKSTKISTKLFGSRMQVSIFVHFKDKDIPTKPLESTVKVCKTRSWDEHLEVVKEMFEKRPIWSKAAILYHTGISLDQSKILIPMVAYHFSSGPFRSLWVRYGYDPRVDSKSRMYQILDYRIRNAESSSLKVNAKRTYTCKKTFSLGPNNVERISLKGNISAKPKFKQDERCYILRPNTIPPARQMLYQLCDVLLPEVQEMINRLPRYPGQVCDAKNGWLPRNFSDQCREIVNRYVLQAVQKELLDDDKVQQEKALKQAKEADKPSSSSNLDYCSQMLSNIKKGIYKKVNFGLSVPSTSSKMEVDEPVVEQIVEEVELSSGEDEDEDDEDAVEELIQGALPERLEEQEEDEEVDFDQEENLSSEDDDELDLEACAEIRQMISESKRTN